MICRNDENRKRPIFSLPICVRTITSASLHASRAGPNAFMLTGLSEQFLAQPLLNLGDALRFDCSYGFCCHQAIHFYPNDFPLGSFYDYILCASWQPDINKEWVGRGNLHTSPIQHNKKEISHSVVKAEVSLIKRAMRFPQDVSKEDK